VGERIHPSAIVEKGAEIGSDVEIGPYAFVGGGVRVGARTTIGAHAVVRGRTLLGEDNRVFHHASIGADPQDLKFHGEPSELSIGDRNQIREFTTLHVGTEAGGMVTRIGSDNMLMNYTHVAHDCTIGDRNVLANGVQLGGHVTLQDWIVVGALTGIHQFVRIGESAMIGAGSMVSMDVVPFCNATGDRATLRGLNSVGLKRRSLSPEVGTALKRAYKLLFRSGLKVGAAAERIRSTPDLPAEVERMLAFAESSQRGICR
jgi:UDP-N-acetylglucosamine acyltransferase